MVNLGHSPQRSRVFSKGRKKMLPERSPGYSEEQEGSLPSSACVLICKMGPSRGRNALPRVRCQERGWTRVRARAGGEGTRADPGRDPEPSGGCVDGQCGWWGHEEMGTGAGRGPGAGQAVGGGAGVG